MYIKSKLQFPSKASVDYSCAKAETAGQYHLLLLGDYPGPLDLIHGSLTWWEEESQKLY